MKSRKQLLKKSRLYLILDRQTLANRSLESIYSAASGSKIDLIQLRDKQSGKPDLLKLAVQIAKRLRLTQTLFIVNDYLDLAVAAQADGLHLGQDDLALKQARKILGPNRIIGVSCHSLAQALQAQKDGADYIGMGPIFSTATKPEYKPIGLEVLGKLKSKLKIPYFAIGDVSLDNVKKIVAAGGYRIAVCRAILKAARPKGVVEQFNKILK